MIRPFDVRSPRADSRTLLATLGALACLSALGACNELPRQRGGSVETVATGKLEKKAPIDVVVAPIENSTGQKSVPVAMLRDAFQQGLVRRRYSPLAPEYVDRKVVDAAYHPGALKEEATLLVTIEHWDDSLWEARNALIVKARARLVDAQDPAAAQLWAGWIDRRFDFGNEREGFSTQAALVRHACEQIASEMLAALPARSPGPAR